MTSGKPNLERSARHGGSLSVRVLAEVLSGGLGNAVYGALLPLVIGPLFLLVGIVLLLQTGWDRDVVFIWLNVGTVTLSVIAVFITRSQVRELRRREERSSTSARMVIERISRAEDDPDTTNGPGVNGEARYVK